MNPLLRGPGIVEGLERSAPGKHRLGFLPSLLTQKGFQPSLLSPCGPGLCPAGVTGRQRVPAAPEKALEERR